MRVSSLLSLALMVSGCISERSFISPEGKLEFEIVGRFFNDERAKSWQGPVQRVQVEISKKDGKYTGTIDRKIVHLRDDKIFMVHYKAELYGARHSAHEINFRDRIILSCGYYLKDGIKKPILDLVLEDFKGPDCRSKENLEQYQAREEKEEFGSIYFNIKNNSEIWWSPKEDMRSIKLVRQMDPFKTESELAGKIFPP